VGWWLEDENNFPHHNYFKKKDVHWHIPIDPALVYLREPSVLGRHPKLGLIPPVRAEIKEK